MRSELIKRGSSLIPTNQTKCSKHNNYSEHISLKASKLASAAQELAKELLKVFLFSMIGTTSWRIFNGFSFELTLPELLMCVCVCVRPPVCVYLRTYLCTYR